LIELLTKARLDVIVVFTPCPQDGERYCQAFPGAFIFRKLEGLVLVLRRLKAQSPSCRICLVLDECPSVDKESFQSVLELLQTRHNPGGIDLVLLATQSVEQLILFDQSPAERKEDNNGQQDEEANKRQKRESSGNRLLDNVFATYLLEDEAKRVYQCCFQTRLPGSITERDFIAQTRWKPQQAVARIEGKLAVYRHSAGIVGGGRKGCRLLTLLNRNDRPQRDQMRDDFSLPLSFSP